MNNRGRLVVDVFIAVVAAALTLILAPGLGVVAIIVAIVVIICAISLAVDKVVRRRRPRAIGHDPRVTGSTTSTNGR